MSDLLGCFAHFGNQQHVCYLLRGHEGDHWCWCGRHPEKQIRQGEVTMDKSRGTQLAMAASEVIEKARVVVRHHMPLTEESYVGLTVHAEELQKAIAEFERIRDSA